MSNLDQKSYQNHKDCSIGDTIIATDANGTEYRGTVFDTKGATVYVQSTDQQVLQFRRLNTEQTIVMAINEAEITDEQVKKGVNPDGLEITQEQATLSFDQEIVDFESESQELTIG